MPEENDRILEIGPGPGALTRALEAQPHASLLLLEKDRYWARQRQKEAGPRTQAVCMDGLRFPWQKLTAALPWKIAGNLPYNVASPLIWDIVALACWRRAVFMVQKEVGQRLAAVPGNRQYGALSVWVQSHARPTMEFCVGPGAFLPPPKVDSAVLSFTPMPPELCPQHPYLLTRLLHICFQQRRKQLRSIFRNAALPILQEILKCSGLDPAARPEVLRPQDYQVLTVLWARHLDNGA